MSGMQTGGAKRSWLFDATSAEQIAPIRDALVHHDVYFEDEETGDTTLSMVLDWILEEMPQDLAESIRLVYLEGKSYRAAGRTIGVDHKTVISRCNRGVKLLQSKLVDTAWVAEMLRGYIPADEVRAQAARRTAQLTDVVNRIGERHE
jgi:DNA-directed RNA polymerase specialized sigma24 family protein